MNDSKDRKDYDSNILCHIFFLRKSYLCEIRFIDYKIMTCLENLIKILKVNQCFIHLLF